MLDDLRPLEHDPALQVRRSNVNEIQQSRTNGVNTVLARANAGSPASIVQVCLLLAKSDALKEYVSMATSNTQTMSKTTYTFRVLRLAEPVLYISGEVSSCNLFGTYPFNIITTRGSRLRENGVSPGRVAAVASSALENPPPLADDKPTEIRAAPLTVGAWTDALGREMVSELPAKLGAATLIRALPSAFCRAARGDDDAPIPHMRLAVESFTCMHNVHTSARLAS